MAASISLVEARVRDAEDFLTQMPQDQSQRPSPRVLKRLEDAEDALKAQCQRKGHLTKYCLSKDQDVKANKVRVGLVRCRRPGTTRKWTGHRQAKFLMSIPLRN